MQVLAYAVSRTHTPINGFDEERVQDFVTEHGRLLPDVDPQTRTSRAELVRHHDGWTNAHRERDREIRTNSETYRYKPRRRPQPSGLQAPQITCRSYREPGTESAHDREAN